MKNENYNTIPIELRYKYEGIDELVSNLTIISLSLEKAQKEIKRIFNAIEDEF